jgi:hypothetical protein
MSRLGTYVQALIMGATGGLGIAVAVESHDWFHWVFSALSGMLIVTGAGFLATENQIALRGPIDPLRIDCSTCKTVDVGFGHFCDQSTRRVR